LPECRVWFAVPGFYFHQNILEESEMGLGFGFFFTNIMLGVGLAMDAFSVALANGLNEPAMRKRKMCGIAGMFSFFQALMPMLGWVCIHTIVNTFQAFEKCIPWIALALLGFIGGKMLMEGIRGEDDEEDGEKAVGFMGLMVQGVATSIDALSVGFTIADYDFFMALLAAVIIAVVTFFICFGGLEIGKKVGTKLAGKASILGGVILIFIGLEIFVTGVF
jgi:putative Mn2+ efflux pump MntP